MLVGITTIIDLDLEEMSIDVMQIGEMKKVKKNKRFTYQSDPISSQAI